MYMRWKIYGYIYGRNSTGRLLVDYHIQNWIKRKNNNEEIMKSKGIYYLRFNDYKRIIKINEP
jgi:hypothetical protein